MAGSHACRCADSTARLRKRAAVAAVLASCLLLLCFDASAWAVADGGWAETNTDLAIRPDPIDPAEAAVEYWNPIMFVDMPVTKEVRSVELGDLRSDATCTTPVQADLIIEEHRDSEPYGTPDTIGGSSATATLPATPGKVKWDIPPRTFEKGIGYAFRVKPRSGGCSKAKYTTWRHDSNIVLGGSNPCGWDPTSATSSKRIWISAVQPPMCPISNYDPSMPTGWLWTIADPYRSGWSKVSTRSSVYPDPPPPGTECMSSGSYRRGGTWKYWRQEPGSNLYQWVCEWDNFVPLHSDVSPTSKGWHYALPWLVGRQPSTRKGGPRDMHVTLEAINYESLMAKHKPKMFYSADENYFADAAESMTEYRMNSLWRGDTVMADHDDRLDPPIWTEPPLLTIGVLGSSYPAGYIRDNFGEPTTDDRIKQGGDPHVASTEMRAAGHGDRAYARVVYGSDAKLWIQYWFFYYYNDFWAGAGSHEGDWEMIQVGLDSSHEPDVVAYATHDDGDRCSFANVQAPGTTSTPQVYVARGSHASYWEWGETALEGPNPGVDHHYGDLVDPPQPTLEYVTGELNFWGWPGRWGAQDGLGPKSPIAPREQGKWSDPSGFYASADPCVAGARNGKRRNRHDAPAYTRKLGVPKILATTRSRSHAIVHYTAKRSTQTQEPLMVEVVVRPHDSSNPARSEVRPLRTGRQSARVVLPAGGGPYTVQVRMVDRRNRFGRRVTRTLP